MLVDIKERLQRRRNLREIDAMTDADLDDIGLSRGVLSDLVSTDGAVIARQMEMAWRHGVTDRVFGIARQDYASIVARCRTCGAASDCATFLADPSRPVAEATFCPNAAAYRDLAAE
ncbi:MAG: hypothetical protein RLZZ528_1086 [Pseudomonadota bacterium]|jgi:hypothetical protein